MTHKLIFFGFLLLLLSSCVPNRKLVYMQKDDVKKDDVKLDSTVRTYNLSLYDIKVRPQDVLSIRFSSLSPEEFDFLASANTPPNMLNPATAALAGELVNPEGEVNYPVIGKVKVAGLTVFEIQNKLTELAKQFLESPKVTVRLVNFRVTVLGEVKAEGQVTTINNRVSIMEIIGMAGGLGELADRGKIKIIRQLDNGTMTVQYINVLDENIVTSPFYYAQQNDIIIVPPLKQRPFRTYFGPNLALIVSTVSVLLLTYNLINN
jgi:polysaccharide export outer membrane protein